MTELEQQAEELEALASIYDGDLCFKQVNNTTFQYKVCLWKFVEILKFYKYFYEIFQYGEEETIKTFMIEVSWQPQYPNELPKISLDLYYNRNM